MSVVDLRRADEIVERHQGERGAAIRVLQELQEEYHYLPREVLERASQELEVPLSQLMHAASFFKAFSLEPRGRYCIQVCLGTACHVRGSRRILDRIERELGIGPGETTPDGTFTLETVNCLGACALGPLVVVNRDYHGRMALSKVERLLRSCVEAE